MASRIVSCYLLLLHGLYLFKFPNKYIAKIEVDASIVGNPQQNAPTTGAAAAAAAPSSTSASSQPQTGKKRTVALDSSDKLYEDLRDTNFAIVGNLLNKVSRRLQADYEVDTVVLLV